MSTNPVKPMPAVSLPLPVVLWQDKWWIALIAALVFALAAGGSLLLPNRYRSEVVLAPSEGAAGGGLSAIAGQLGGLASLAGISLGGGSDNKVAIALEILSSRKFIGDFVERHDLWVPLMAVRGWRRDANQLVIDANLYDVQKGEWVRDVALPFLPKPSRQEAFEVFSGLLDVTEDQRSGMVVIHLTHYSPFVAQQWLDWLVHDLNQFMRENDVALARRSIDYIQKKLEDTDSSEMRQVFFQLIERQLQTAMLAEVEADYVFRTLDPPLAPERKYSPKRSLIAAAGLVLGVMLGGGWSCYRRREQKHGIV